MTKLESLQKLNAWNYNIMDFIQFTSEIKPEDLLQRFDNKKLGVRVSNAGILAPFKTDMDYKECHRFASEQLSHFNEVIIYENPQNNPVVFQGNILLRQDGSGIIDIYYGDRGTLRDVENKNTPDLSRAFQRFSYIPDDIKYEIADLRTLPDLCGRDITIEFTVFKNPTGIQQQKLILWEIR
jgi:hypothetical protein